MKKPIYYEDSYVKEFTTKVTQVTEEKFIILEDTIFYPKSGGQLNDIGTITKENEEYPIIFVGKFNGQISHETSKSGLKEGDEITCKIDWNRRYKSMRSHTSAHIVSKIINNMTGALITGNQLTEEKVRIDFNVENYDPVQLKKVIESANKIIEHNLPLKVYYMTREEVEQKPELTKLAKGLPEGIKELRIVEIEGFDVQADGGTHVKSTKEVGKLEFLKAENKGKNNRRIYYKLTE